MKILTVTLALICFFSGNSFSQTDPLEELKKNMSEADCSRFEFVSILESEIFDSVDSTLGSALIASDGRYRVTIGPDEYLRTAELLYSYSTENNQVTVERFEPAGSTDESISFITRLDDYFETSTSTGDNRYLLTRLDSASTNLPESLTVQVVADPLRLDRLEFLDDNGDLNRIVFVDSEFLSQCSNRAFEPQFPDSTEIIKLY